MDGHPGRQSCKLLDTLFINRQVPYRLAASLEPVIWRMWPGKARRGKAAEEGEGDKEGGTAGARGQRKSQNRPGLEPERVPGGRSSQCKAQEVGPCRVGEFKG